MGRRSSYFRSVKKINCEICSENNRAVLHRHHIIPRTDPLCTDEWDNVCVICSNCHNKTHAGQINIIGVFSSTKLPYKRTLVFEENGKCNVPDLASIPFKPTRSESMKVFL
jgi:hypothetical protein